MTKEENVFLKQILDRQKTIEALLSRMAAGSLPLEEPPVERIKTEYHPFEKIAASMPVGKHSPFKEGDPAPIFDVSVERKEGKERSLQQLAEDVNATFVLCLKGQGKEERVACFTAGQAKDIVKLVESSDGAIAGTLKQLAEEIRRTKKE